MCGIAAVYNPANPIVRELYELGMALQHRGEESAGIAVSMDGDLFVYKDRGHVDDVFHGLGKASFNSYAGIVHTRYSTTGLSGRKNAQPIRVGKVALGHNGNLVNTDELRQMFGERYDFDTTTDSELIACIFDEAPDMPTGAETASRLCKGSYNLVLLNNRGELGVFRDPSGNHPISVGFKGSALYAASEDFAFQHLATGQPRIAIAEIGAHQTVVEIRLRITLGDDDANLRFLQHVQRRAADERGFVAGT